MRIDHAFQAYPPLTAEPLPDLKTIRGGLLTPNQNSGDRINISDEALQKAADEAIYEKYAGIPPKGMEAIFKHLFIVMFKAAKEKAMKDLPPGDTLSEADLKGIASQVRKEVMAKLGFPVDPEAENGLMAKAAEDLALGDVKYLGPPGMSTDEMNRRSERLGHAGNPFETEAFRQQKTDLYLAEKSKGTSDEMIIEKLKGLFEAVYQNT